jgi:serine/threonine-protein kinase RsbW
MKNNIEIEIKLPNQTRYLNLIGKIGEDLARELCEFEGNRENLVNDIKVVLTEAVANAIIHANGADPDKEVRLSITVSDGQICIRVYDRGKGFCLDRIPAPSTNSERLEEKGRGIFIIRSLMDSVEYRRADGENVLEMKKRLD